MLMVVLATSRRDTQQHRAAWPQRNLLNVACIPVFDFISQGTDQDTNFWQHVDGGIGNMYPLTFDKLTRYSAASGDMKSRVSSSKFLGLDVQHCYQYVSRYKYLYPSNMLPTSINCCQHFVSRTVLGLRIRHYQSIENLT